MEYACLLYAAEDAEPGPDAYAEFMAVSADAQNAGVMKAARGLADASSATTVRVRDGKRILTDGPFAETKEILAGFFIFECPSLDAAIEWAARLPASRYGCVEVRPVRGVEHRSRTHRSSVPARVGAGGRIAGAGLR
jgi:hypothetical protein